MSSESPTTVSIKKQNFGLVNQFAYAIALEGDRASASGKSHCKRQTGLVDREHQDSALLALSG
jgi:hypothetical protein